MKACIFLLLITLLSCNEKKTSVEKIDQSVIRMEKVDTISDDDQIESSAWFKYYKKLNPHFISKNFILENTSPITYSESSIKILNQRGFNKIYKPFFVFNRSKNKYIDFDSYYWEIAGDGNASFEADQQINLVDLKLKTAKQLSFFGPSYWIEDAFWKGDSVAVLLGNSYEKVPFFLKFNFDKNKAKSYINTDTLHYNLSYKNYRLQKKGIKLN